MSTELLYFPKKEFSPRFGDTFFTFNIKGHEIQVSNFHFVIHSRDLTSYCIRVEMELAGGLLQFITLKY